MLLHKYEEYLGWFQLQALSEHSRRAYSRHVGGFVRFANDQSAPFDQVDDYIEFLSVEMLAKPSTLNAILAAISHFAKFCGHGPISRARKQYAVRNNCALQSLDSEAQIRLLQVVANQGFTARDIALFYFLFYTGSRPAECCRLNLADLDFERGFVRITNNSGSSREVNLVANLRASLKRWMEERQLSLSEDRSVSGCDAPLFVTANHKRISPAVVDAVVRKLGIKAGLVISARTIRNTFMLNLVASGCSAQCVAKMSGHRRPGLVKRYFDVQAIR